MILKLYDYLIEVEVAYDNFSYSEVYEITKKFIQDELASNYLDHCRHILMNRS